MRNKVMREWIWKQIRCGVPGTATSGTEMGHAGRQPES